MYHRLKYCSNSEEKLGIRIIKGSLFFPLLFKRENYLCLKRFACRKALLASGSFQTESKAEVEWLMQGADRLEPEGAEIVSLHIVNCVSIGQTGEIVRNFGRK